MAPRHTVVLALTLTICTTVTACATEPPVYESLSGTFSGAFVSTDPSGNEYEGQLTLQLLQDEAGVTGTWEVMGEINGRTSSEGTGPFVTTIPLGPDPSFTARLSYSLCLDGIMEFDGQYHSSEETITLTGPLDIPSSACNVVTQYPLSVVLTR